MYNESDLLLYNESDLKTKNKNYENYNQYNIK